MNNNNPNLIAKYEEAYKIKQTPAQITKTNGEVLLEEKKIDLQKALVDNDADFYRFVERKGASRNKS